jgi:hypothetical protein
MPAEMQPPTIIFQVIQHPHGISLTKPKITKALPPTPAKIQKIHVPLVVPAETSYPHIVPIKEVGGLWT